MTLHSESAKEINWNAVTEAWNESFFLIEVTFYCGNVLVTLASSPMISTVEQFKQVAERLAKNDTTP